MSFKIKKSMTVNPKNLAQSVINAEKKKDIDSESKMTEKLDLETELGKLTEGKVKDKSFK